MEEFDRHLYVVKALSLAGIECEGYYYGGDGGNSINDGWGFIDINPYTICRNTGIKKNETYFFENDLVEYSTTFDKGLAIIEFDEMRCRYMLRFNLDYSSRGDIDRYNIKVVGNVTLSDYDMKRFAEYSKNQIFIKDVEPECRSKAHINKRAKEFLPK